MRRPRWGTLRGSRRTTADAPTAIVDEGQQSDEDVAEADPAEDTASDATADVRAVDDSDDSGAAEQDTDDSEDSDDSDTEPERPAVVRPSRPAVTVGRQPPVMLPPTPPALLNHAASAWKVTALGLGLAVGLTVLALSSRREGLHNLVVSLAPDLTVGTQDRVTSVVLYGTLILWAVLAILSLILAKGLRTPKVLPRVLAILVWGALWIVLSLTAMSVTGDEGMALIARGFLVLAGLAALVGVVLSVLPASWRFVRENRAPSAPRPGTEPQPGPPQPSPGR